MRHGRFPAVFLAITAIIAIAASADARRSPDRTDMWQSQVQPARSVGEEAFSCGTYKGNEAQTGWMLGRHRQMMRNLASGNAPAVKAMPLNYVYDNVWIIEDDGTLTFSGFNPFDTNLQTFNVAPTGSAYTVTSATFVYDATLGTQIFPGDDGHVLTNLLFTFNFGGAAYTQCYVGGNGIVSFGGIPNPSGFYQSDDFFNSTRKIAAYYMDLNPAAAGGVYVKSEATKCTITWNNVPDYGTANLNRFQVVLFNDGHFTLTYNGIASTTQVNGSPIILGLSQGNPALLESISFSSDLPFTGANGAGIYEDYVNITNPIVNEAGLFQRFYQTYPDEFFQLVFFTNFVQTMGGFANELNIKNDVTGIGLGLFDNSAAYGSNGVLESRCNMNRLAAWNLDPFVRFFSKENNFLTIMGQEAGHRWGAFMNFVDAGSQVSNLILGRSDAHWSYFVDNDHSSLEGGDWSLVSGSTYTCPTKIDYFPGIDEYTFGLRTPEEVKDLYYLDSPTNNLLSNRDDGTPIQNAIASGTPIVVTVDDIIAAEGARTPTEPNENKDLRQGFILLVAQSTTPTQVQLDQIALFRKSWEDYFEKSCDGRLTCNTSITQNYAVGVIKGQVKSVTTQQNVADFTATSIQRSFVQHVPAGGRYTFRYQANATSGSSEAVTIVFSAAGFYPDTLQTVVSYGSEECTDVYLTPIPTNVAPGTPLPDALYQNVPNPFNPETSIAFDLSAPGVVELAIYDIRGSRVRLLADGFATAGHHTESWDGRDDSGQRVASGVYFYRLEANGFSQTRRMVLLK